MKITLSNAELYTAALVGSLRRIQSISRGYNANVHAQKSDWATDIDGAAAEMAVSKFLGRYWSCHAGNLYGDDILGGIQVRSTNHPNGHLIIRERDKPHSDSLFILVICAPPQYSIVGGMRGKDAMCEAYWKSADGNGVGSWWIPQSHLEAVGNLEAAE